MCAEDLQSAGSRTRVPRPGRLGDSRTSCPSTHGPQPPPQPVPTVPEALPPALSVQSLSWPHKGDGHWLGGGGAGLWELTFLGLGAGQGSCALQGGHPGSWPLQTREAAGWGAASPLPGNRRAQSLDLKTLCAPSPATSLPRGWRLAPTPGVHPWPAGQGWHPPADLSCGLAVRRGTTVLLLPPSLSPVGNQGQTGRGGRVLVGKAR